MSRGKWEGKGRLTLTAPMVFHEDERVLGLQRRSICLFEQVCAVIVMLLNEHYVDFYTLLKIVIFHPDTDYSKIIRLYFISKTFSFKPFTPT